MSVVFWEARCRAASAGELGRSHRRRGTANGSGVVCHRPYDPGVDVPEQIPYQALVAAHGPTSGGWDRFVRGVLIDRWIEAYARSTSWEPEVLNVDQGALTFLFDAAPTLSAAGGSQADDRVVAVWGWSSRPERPRDRRRLSGFLPSAGLWSGRQRDRGHLVAHAAGGGLDINLFPQGRALNRGRSEEGRRWRRIEQQAAGHPGTPLFVRPVYRDDTWVPISLDYGLLVGELWLERFANPGQ